MSTNCCVSGAAAIVNADGSVTPTTRDVNPLDGLPWDFTIQFCDKTGTPLFALSHYDCLNALKKAVAMLDARLTAAKL